jgi:hypothetical protein
MIKRIVKQHPIRIIFACLCIMTFMGIKFWEYYAPLSIHGRNNSEISRIKVGNPADFTFAVFGDNKGNSSVFEPLLCDIDHRTEIGFAIGIGDQVRKREKGLYRSFLNQVKENLTIPLLTAIGNHDLNGGSSIYQGIFGPTYYAFQVGQSHFIVLDAVTEGKFDKRERQWLEEELKKAQTLETRFVFIHVPPFDPRGKGFNKCLTDKDGEDLRDLFRRYNVTHLFASQVHGYFSGIWEGVPYTITGGVGGSLQGSNPEHSFHHYVKVHVHGGNVDMAVRQIDSEGIMPGFFGLIQDYALDWGSLLGASISLFTVALSMRNRYGS